MLDERSTSLLGERLMDARPLARWPYWCTGGFGFAITIITTGSFNKGWSHFQNLKSDVHRRISSFIMAAFYRIPL